MKPKREQKKASTGLIFFVAGYLLTFAVIIIVLSIFINHAIRGDYEKSFSIAIIGTGILVILLSVVIIKIIQFLRERKRDDPGIHIKLKIILFFALIIVLASLPFIILTPHILIQFTDAWYNPTIGKALQSGRDTSLIYYNDVTENILALTKSEELIHILRETQDNPKDAWKRIKDINNRIDGLQIVIDGNEYFSGKADCYRSNPLFASFSPGLLPTRKIDGFSIISGYCFTTMGTKSVHIIVSDRIPKEFSSESGGITAALRQYKLFGEIAGFTTPFTIAIFFFSALPLVLLSLILALFLSERITTPLTSIHFATRKIAGGDFTYRLINRPGNDFSSFIHAFNSMAKELEHSQSRVRQTEKVTAWQEISKRLAHELKNPLTPIKLTAQRILRKIDKGEDPAAIADILPSSMNLVIDEVNRLDLMLLDFKYFANQKKPELILGNIIEFLTETLNLFQTGYPDIKFSIESIKNPLEISFDAELLTQAFINIIKNSIDAVTTVKNGAVSISVTLVQKGFKQYCRIRIRDNGAGIPFRSIDQVFQPYFSTKENRLGLGLPTAERIITSHQGLVWLESIPEKECVLFIDLPVTAKATENKKN